MYARRCDESPWSFRLFCCTTNNMEISDTDFVNSFLKAARLRKMSVIAIYGTTETGRAVMRMVSNAGPGPTQGILGWLREQPVSPRPGDPCGELRGYAWCAGEHEAGDRAEDRTRE